MKKEHTVYFKIMHGAETKQLTALIYLEENTLPTVQDYELCLKQCGHDVHIIDKEQFIFRSNNPADDYLIDVLENYKKNDKDLYANHLAQSFVKKTPFL
ncbi:hypothetical protein BK133_23610 [Paenibacillus sp. FSL H8-0548]|uniref:hypothetical protein n=1 Tax=Paenibacillus sp. FSL H8-0548 TaxID=1920422 RepID=UPI00096F69E1|nr:hypothetical protein [Paenibacillus sp. FSL H8-0548]OMF23877.1 hypothetical protein BK133_23610 [Paenibacillus sp. FSL H8-0548]